MASYIHELEGWPSFKWSSQDLAEQLAAVRHRQGRLLGRMEALGFELRAEAVLQTLTEDVLKSSEIEGEILDKEQVRSSIARRLGMDIGGLDAGRPRCRRRRRDDARRHPDLSRAAHRRAAVRLARCAVSDRAQRHDENHRRRLARRPSGPMQVVSGPIGREQVHYEAPAADRLDGEMTAFLEWFNGADAARPGLEGGGRPSVVRHDPSLRGRQRPDRPRHRRHDAGALGRQPATLLQHVRADPPGAEGLLRHPRADPEGRPRHHRLAAMVPGLPRPAFDGAEAILADVLPKARFWEAMRASRSTNASARSSTACWTVSKASSPLRNGRR